jgi:hypothetical protein
MARRCVLASAFAGLALGAGIIRNATDLEASYDYVVAGGGLSGLVVANRLSEDPEGKGFSIPLLFTVAI